MKKTRRIHELKIAPRYFSKVANGDKPFEVRRSDRDYQVGDILKLREYDGGIYSGQEICAKVTCILDDPEYCKEGYVTMGIRIVGEESRRATEWFRSTETLPENRGQKCLLWMNGRAYLASFVSPEWGFDLDGRQECVMAHQNLWWMPIVSPDESKK